MATDINLGYFRINDPQAPQPGFADTQGHVWPVGVIHWQLPDTCDEISIDVNEKHVLASTMVGIRLMTQPGMWFKGIEAHRSDGSVTKVEAEDGHMTDPMLLAVLDLAATTLFFIKAKFAGVHTDVYHLRASDLKAFAGSVITFNWRRDSC
jgi:hypothetical protein